MGLAETVEMLEAMGFHMFRKILYRHQPVGAALVYTPIDLYSRLIVEGETTYLDFGCGEWHNAEALQDTLPTRLMQFAAEMNETASAFGCETGNAIENEFQEKLVEAEKQAGRKLDCLWQGFNGFWKGLYRGAVFEINNHLRVIAIDGGELAPRDRFVASRKTDMTAGMSLRHAFAEIDRAGGYDEIEVDEPEKL